jgi:hypothetical protein
MPRSPGHPRIIAPALSATTACLAVLLLTLMAAPRPAHACSQPACWSAALVPGPELEQSVPANLPALYWRPFFGAGAPLPDPATVTLARRDRPDQPIELSPSQIENGDVVLVPMTSLEPGVGYRLADSSVCAGSEESGPEILFEAGDEAPLPQSLGELLATDIGVGRVSVATLSGSCAESIEADRVEIALEPSADAAPWLELLHFETLVDGHVWQPSGDITVLSPPGASWMGRGRDLVHASCEPDLGQGTDPGVDEGSHEVSMRATLPGTDIALETAPVTVDLRCGAGGDDDGGADDGADDGDDTADDGGCSSSRGGGGQAGVLAVLASAALLSRARGRRLIARRRTCDADQA